MKQDNEATKLIRLAERDWAAFRVLRDSDEVDASTAFFHAQQCVEKCLKAVLVFHKQRVPKIHDLLGLVELVGKFTAIPVSDSDLNSLTPYAVEFRYNEVDFYTIDNKFATWIVETIFTWAKEVIGSE
ncbi:MAG: HEPN domain-containing protein [Calditrichota bacterium]